MLDLSFFSTILYVRSSEIKQALYMAKIRCEYPVRVIALDWYSLSDILKYPNNFGIRSRKMSDAFNKPLIFFFPNLDNESFDCSP